MPDYSKSKIYCIRSFCTEEVYIGSTTQPLCKRMYEHKKNYKAWLKDNTRKFISSYEILKYEDAYIELVEALPDCKSREELNAHEGNYIRVMNCVNMCIPGRSQKEWYQENREAQLAKKAEYQKNNDQYISYQTNYRQNNREKIRANAADRVCCPCGSVVRRGDISKHKKTKKHRQCMFNLHNELNHITL